MCVKFLPQLLSVHIPDSNVTVLTSCGKQNIAALVVLAPLNRVDGAAELIKNVNWLALFGFPKTYQMILRS